MVFSMVFCYTVSQNSKGGLSMSVFERVSAVLGLLGFILGVVNILLRVSDRRPAMRCTIGDKQCFHGKWTIRGALSMEEKEGSIIDFVLGIANISQINNTVEKIDCEADHPLKPVPEQPIARATNTIKNLTDKPVNVDVHWKRPDREWRLLVPQPIQPGSTIEASICYRIPGPPLPPGEEINIRVSVKDCFGKTHTKRFSLQSKGFAKKATTLG